MKTENKKPDTTELNTQPIVSQLPVEEPAAEIRRVNFELAEAYKALGQAQREICRLRGFDS